MTDNTTGEAQPTSGELAEKYGTMQADIYEGMVAEFSSMGLDKVEIARRVIGMLAMAAAQAGNSLGVPPVITALIAAEAMDGVLLSGTRDKAN
jgi:hypothetical protein